jgi:glycosyl transferase family 87
MNRSELARSKSVRVASLLGLVLIGLAALSVRGSSYFSDPRRAEKDLADDYASVRLWRDGRNPFETNSDAAVNHYLKADQQHILFRHKHQPNGHPPFHLLFMLPLGYLTYEQAGLVWVLFSAAALIVAAVLFGRELGLTPLVSAAVGTGALALPVVQSDFNSGQINVILLCLITVAWIHLKNGRQNTSGVLLGIAAALKVFPLALVVPCIAMRRPRTALITVGVAAGVSISSAVVVGHTSNYLKTFGTHRQWISAMANLSLVGRISSSIGGIAAVLIAASMLLLMLHRSTHLTDPYLASIPLMILLWPVSWDHYSTLTIPWFVVGIRRATGWRLALLAPAVLLVLTLSVPTMGVGFGVMGMAGLMIGTFAERFPDRNAPRYPYEDSRMAPQMSP